VRTLDRILQDRAKPKYLFVDNGSEFSGRMYRLSVWRAINRCTVYRACLNDDWWP